MAKTGIQGNAESLSVSVKRAMAETASVHCETYHIDFFRCVIRKSFARSESGGGAA